jgi:hypothetical protein
MCGVGQRFGSGSEKQGSEQALDQSPAGLSPRTVRHLDLLIAEAGLGGGLVGHTQTTELMLVTIAALRCS